MVEAIDNDDRQLEAGNYGHGIDSTLGPELCEMEEATT
jgi:hypothetical protein